MLSPRLAVCLASAILEMSTGGGARERPARPTEDRENRLAPSKKNATAEDLESLALALGIDFRRQDPSAEHPTREDLDAYRKADFGSWLEAQLKNADDSIAPPPASVQNFLSSRQPTVWRAAGLLERDVPEWDLDPHKGSKDLGALLGAVGLNRVLLSAALVEEKAGHHAQAGNLLEASWSLSRFFAGQPDWTAQLIFVTLRKLQAGALRKMAEPPTPWVDRLSGDEPRRRMLDLLEESPPLSGLPEELSLQEVRLAQARAWRGVADRLRELSPCEVAKLSSEEIWKPAVEEIERSLAAGADPSLKTLSDMATPNLTGAIRRAGRLLVDSELTAKVLELKQEKAASRDGRWPERLFDSDSRVCPGAAYEYQSRGGAMSIRFKGQIDDPGAPALALALSFESRPPRATPTPTPARTRRATTPSRPRT
jgi:hypothetical protein